MSPWFVTSVSDRTEVLCVIVHRFLHIVRAREGVRCAWVCLCVKVTHTRLLIKPYVHGSVSFLTVLLVAFFQELTRSNQYLLYIFFFLNIKRTSDGPSKLPVSWYCRKRHQNELIKHQMDLYSRRRVGVWMSKEERGSFFSSGTAVVILKRERRLWYTFHSEGGTDVHCSLQDPRDWAVSCWITPPPPFPPLSFNKNLQWNFNRQQQRRKQDSNHSNNTNKTKS